MESESFVSELNGKWEFSDPLARASWDRTVVPWLVNYCINREKEGHPCVMPDKDELSVAGRRMLWTFRGVSVNTYTHTQEENGASPTMARNTSYSIRTICYLYEIKQVGTRVGGWAGGKVSTYPSHITVLLCNLTFASLMADYATPSCTQVGGYAGGAVGGAVGGAAGGAVAGPVGGAVGGELGHHYGSQIGKFVRVQMQSIEYVYCILCFCLCINSCAYCLCDRQVVFAFMYVAM